MAVGFVIFILMIYFGPSEESNGWAPGSCRVFGDCRPDPWFPGVYNDTYVNWFQGECKNKLDDDFCDEKKRYCNNEYGYMLENCQKTCFCDTKECLTTWKGTEYKGTQNTTVSGRTCINWEGTEENYCRNSDESEKPWCHIENEFLKEDCDIPYCGNPYDYWFTYGAFPGVPPPDFVKPECENKESDDYCETFKDSCGEKDVRKKCHKTCVCDACKDLKPYCHLDRSEGKCYFSPEKMKKRCYNTCYCDTYLDECKNKRKKYCKYARCDDGRSGKWCAKMCFCDQWRPRDESDYDSSSDSLSSSLEFSSDFSGSRSSSFGLSKK